MRRLRGYWSLVVLVTIAVLAMLYTSLANNKPLLGLDLQGGVSVVLEPKGDIQEGTLDQAITIIRQRVDALGVAEPEITRQGDNILIQIPGVADKDRAIELVGQTAELQFRPVLNGIPAGVSLTDPGDTTGDTTGDSTGDTVTDSTDTTAPTADSADSSTTTVGAADGGEQGLGLAPGEYAAGGSVTPPTLAEVGDELAQAETPSTDAPASTDTTAPADTTDSTVPVDPNALSIDPSLILPDDICVTGVPSDQLNPTGDAVLPECDDQALVYSYQVGPVALTGNTLSTARAVLGPNGQWTVNPEFKGGADGIDQFNAIASQCYSKAATCPTGQLAIVLDGRVISAPVIQTPSFQADQIEISGTFSEGEAKDLATSLRYGALPVEFEQQQAQIVSATLGEDALRAGLVSGAVGLALVALYMIVFYRLLGLLAVIKLAIEGALLWSVISYLGSSSGLALTLAGITGIIVSIGVSVDSNVVYYEHMKEDVLKGKSLRTSVDKSFTTAFSTIVKADVASLIAAGLLWWLTVGPVRGFAFYLGLSTLLDLIGSWAYMRPAVHLVSRSRFARMPKVLGLPVEAEPADGGPAVPPRPSTTAGGVR